MPFVGTQLSGTIFGTLVFSVDSFDSEGIQFSRNWFVQKGPEVCFRAFLTLFWLLAILKAQNWQGLGHFRTSKLASFWHFLRLRKSDLADVAELATALHVVPLVLPHRPSCVNAIFVINLKTTTIKTLRLRCRLTRSALGSTETHSSSILLTPFGSLGTQILNNQRKMENVPVGGCVN